MRCVLPILLLTAAFGSAAEEPKAKPVEFASKEGKFTVTFPDKPKSGKNKIPVGDTEVTIYRETLEFEGCAFIVAYNDYPEGTLDPKPQTVLENVRNGNLGETGKIIDETIGKFGPDKLPMREFTFSKDKVFYRNRLVLDGDRLYQVMVVAEKEKDLTTAVADKLFDSFILDKKKK